jgi:hypothetical protein
VDEHSAQIVPGNGWGHLVPVVVRVCSPESAAGPQRVVVEAPLGLTWGGVKGAPPPWTELARRADLALAQHGFSRTVEWEPHVFPQPIASAMVMVSRP